MLNPSLKFARENQENSRNVGYSEDKLYLKMCGVCGKTTGEACGLSTLRLSQA